MPCSSLAIPLSRLSRAIVAAEAVLDVYWVEDIESALVRDELISPHMLVRLARHEGFCWSSEQDARLQQSLAGAVDIVREAYRRKADEYQRQASAVRELIAAIMEEGGW